MEGKGKSPKPTNTIKIPSNPSNIEIGDDNQCGKPCEVGNTCCENWRLLERRCQSMAPALEKRLYTNAAELDKRCSEKFDELFSNDGEY